MKLNWLKRPQTIIKSGFILSMNVSAKDNMNLQFYTLDQLNELVRVGLITIPVDNTLTSKPEKHLFFSKNANFSPFLLYMHTSLHIIVLETSLFYRAKQKSYQQPEFDRIVWECGRGQKPTHTGIIQKPQSYLLAN